jgi:NAD(P)-dependent dehydrogenase (short-subunit alcohol dehydrogenase family)
MLASAPAKKSFSLMIAPSPIVSPLRVLVTGASRGIGAAVARAYGRAGAHVALLARSDVRASHARLEGTLREVAADVEYLGGRATVVRADLRDAEASRAAARGAVASLGGLDVLVNAASALELSQRPSAAKAALVHGVNVLGTLSVCVECADALHASDHGAMVTFSPPVDLGRADWIAAHPHYTTSKYAMSLMTMGYAGEGLYANCLWPRHTVATAATALLEQAAPSVYAGAHSRGRSPDDVAAAVLALAASDRAGECLFDDEVVSMPPTDAPKDLFVG